MYIPNEIDEDIRDLALFHKASKAEMVRRALKEGIVVMKQKKSTGVEVMYKLAEMGKKYKVKGPKNSSQRIDELLWGKDWSKSE